MRGIILKRIFALFFIAFLSLSIVSACGNEENPLDGIDIEAVDQINVPAGTYIIPYTVEDISNLIKTYGAIVTLTVTDSSGNLVTVSGNTITVIEGEVYSVDIKIMIGDEYKEKTITITAVTPSEMIYHEVNYELHGGQGTFGTQSILSGQHLVIPTTNPTKNGYIFDGWFTDSICLTPFNSSQPITSNVTLYAKWIEESIPVLVTLTFDLQGGSGSFPIQSIEIGTYGQRPTTEPVRDGYIFLGWGVSLETSQPFDFETLSIYQDTVVYAMWMEETPVNQFTVTYDLNGSFTPTPLIELVNEGDYAVGLGVTPVYENYLFMGWSVDADGQNVWDLNEDPVISDMTLYAIWHYDYRYIESSSFFTDPRHSDDSTLVDGDVQQIQSFSIWFDAHDFEIDQSLSENIISYGILYSKTSNSPTYYDRDSIKIDVTFEELQIENIATFIMKMNTHPLESDTEYHVVHYVRYESVVVYSAVQTVQTYIQVQTGSSIGILYMLSGGYYKYEFDSSVFKPSMFIEVLEGYQATLNGNPYSSYDLIERSGTHSLVVKEMLTGHEYLHVFNVTFRKPAVNVVYDSVRSEGYGVDVSYTINYYHEDFYTYPISECGVLLSSSHPYLKLEMPSMTQRIGEIDDQLRRFDMNNLYFPNEDYGDFYARGYVIIQGKISYSDYVTHFSYSHAQMSYQVVKHILVSSEKVSPEYGYTASFGNGIEYQIATISENQFIMSIATGSITFSSEGQYFYMKPGSSYISDLLIIDDFKEVIGVTEGSIYQGGVLITYDMYNPYWYMSKDGGDYIDLPASIRLTEPGFYAIFYRTAQGMKSISFEVK
jgi:uncharacterized repeat protein (TIGR02543 family)